MYRAVAVVAVAWGCSTGSATPDPRPSPSSQSQSQSQQAPRDAAVDADVSRLSGHALYAGLCAPCHGADGRGYAADHAPSLVSPTFLESANDDFLRRSIGLGRPGTSMAAYGKARGGPLDRADVDRLIKYLREQGPAARDRKSVV